jgi:phosphate transport system protein
MIAARHILGTFDESLAALRNNVLMMAGLSERSMERAMKGLIDRNDDLCANTIADDEEIDHLEKQMDKDGVDILLRFQPVASDLRRVVSAMKLSTNLERIGDQATTIARRARKLNQHPSRPCRCSKTASMPSRARMLILVARSLRATKSWTS